MVLRGRARGLAAPPSTPPPRSLALHLPCVRLRSSDASRAPVAHLHLLTLIIPLANAAYWEFGVHAWDFAAASLIVTESGGFCCDTTGGPMDLMSRRVSQIPTSSSSDARREASLPRTTARCGSRVSVFLERTGPVYDCGRPRALGREKRTCFLLLQVMDQMII